MSAAPANDTEAMLRRFHAEHPGATSEVCATPGGDSSYGRLVDLVPRDGAARTVLDLACGDGALLELIRRRGDENMTLVGVDMSPDELRLARQRLGTGVELRLERAQELSLSGASVDCVVCHLALMLMDPVEEAIAQVARVLKPGGTFGAVVNGAPVPGDAWHAFSSAARQLMSRETGLPSMGDRRVLSAEGLRELFNARTGFEEPIAIEDFVLSLDGTLEQVKQRLLLTYAVTMLSPQRLRELVAGMDGLLKPLQRPDGSIPCSLGLRLVRAAREQ